jgi:hypothetical protein|tara:strand:+ start:158 stop:571 length:414 start_codon:yes stop_codon:yes gene_type:complete
MKVLGFRFVMVLGLLCFVGCGLHHHDPVAAASGKVQFASFYAEVAGDFADPIDSDAPAHYAWTKGDVTINTANMEDIWKAIGMPENTPSGSQSEVEIKLLDYLVSNGWELVQFTTYSVPSRREDLQTIYRYIFKRNL